MDGGDGNDIVTYTGQAPTTAPSTAGPGTTRSPRSARRPPTCSATTGTTPWSAPATTTGTSTSTWTAGPGTTRSRRTTRSSSSTVTGGAGTDTLILPADASGGTTGTVLSLNAGQSNGNIDPDDTVENVTALGQYGDAGRGRQRLGQRARLLPRRRRRRDPERRRRERPAGRPEDSYGANDLLDGGDGNDTLVPADGPRDRSSAGPARTWPTTRPAPTPLAIYLDGSHPSGARAAATTDTFDGTVEQVYGGSGERPDRRHGRRQRPVRQRRRRHARVQRRHRRPVRRHRQRHARRPRRRGHLHRRRPRHRRGHDRRDRRHTINTETVTKAPAGTGPAELANGTLTSPARPGPTRSTSSPASAAASRRPSPSR